MDTNNRIDTVENVQTSKCVEAVARLWMSMVAN